jgi:oxygen-dependent protoporphyrinogen oxidase
VTAADPAGVSLDGGERIAGQVILAAPGIAGPRTPGRRVTLVTLVVDAPGLETAPRGTGVLVAPDAGVGARALTHLSAKWRWVADLAGDRHVLRLSYDGDEADVRAASRDAETLLGVPIRSVDDAKAVTWERAPTPTHAVDGMRRVGESVAGTGIAAVVAQADALSLDRPADDTEPQG